jgi:PAS domain S-box-containing protein
VRSAPRRRRRRAQEDTERLLSAIAWALIAVGADGRVARWSAVAEQTFALAADDALGRPFRALPIHWDWAAVDGAIARCRAAAAPVRLDDVPYRRADGGEGLLGVSVHPIRGGRPGGVLILGADVTDRRALERQLALAQRLESLGQLAAGVAHEMNTPIQFVCDNVRFLQEAHAELSRLLAAYRALLGDPAVTVPEDRRGALAAAEETMELAYLLEEAPRAAAQSLEGLERVAAIVRALRHLAHPDHGAMVPVDLNQAVLTTLVMARNEIKRVAEVETDLAELPPVTGHPGALKHALLNLVVNAAHAVGDRLAATGARGRIGIRSRTVGDHVELAISDTGTGIPEAIRHRVFDPFFTTKPVGRGTGQGLAIARSVVVERHGGTLSFESEEGRGTTFYLRLPVARPAAGGQRDGS